MPTYLSPGVYVEEKLSGSAPIVSVGTSTAGFIGVIKADSPIKTDSPKSKSGDSPAAVKTYALANANASDPNVQSVPAGQVILCTNFGEFKKSFGDFSLTG